MTKVVFGAFSSIILVVGLLVASPLLASGQQVAPTDKGTLKVSVSTDPQIPKPSGQTKLKIDFVNPMTGAIQEHIDYSMTITKDGKPVFGPIPLTHTSLGTVTIPVGFKENGEYKVVVDVQGILFQPIPSEKATVTLKIGESKSSDKADSKAKNSDTKKKDEVKKKTKSDKKPVKKPKPAKPKITG